MATRRPNGKWRAQVFLGMDESGKRLYKSFEADTEEEADYEALTFKLGRGKSVEKKKITLRAAIEAYIQSKENLLSPATIASYRAILRNLDHNFLDVNIYAIKTVSLQNAINQYATRDKLQKHNGNGAVSAKSVRNMYGLVSAALKQNGIQMRGITLPAKQKIEYRTPFDADLGAIFHALEGSSLEVPALLAAWCSLRRSEILGLRYSDIDFEHRLIHVRRARVYVGANDFVKNTKTVSSTRTVFLPDYISERIKAGRGDAAEDDYIVKIKGGSITKCFNERLLRAGLPVCRFHDLRHAFVSILAAHGVDGKYIQEMGGWATDRVMNSVYKQTSMEAMRGISEGVDQVFLGILQPNATEKN